MVAPSAQNSQTSLVKVQDQIPKSLISQVQAQGRELELAVSGTWREISGYLDETRRLHGRTQELVSADRITSTQKIIQLTRLVGEDRILNHNDPSGPGSVDEHVAVLRRMARDISECCLPDEGPTVACHMRYLVELDVDLNPPAVRLTTVPGVREVFARLLDSCFRKDGWDYYAQTPDLHYFGHDHDIPVKNWDPIRMESVSDEAIRQALAARRWPDVAEVADLLASLKEDTAAVPGMLPPPGPASLADQLRALNRGGDFLITMADLAAELSRRSGMAVNPQGLQMRVRKAAAELALAGVWVGATTDREPKSRRALYRVRIENHPSHPSHPSPVLLPGETREG